MGLFLLVRHPSLPSATLKVFFPFLCGFFSFLRTTLAMEPYYPLFPIFAFLFFLLPLIPVDKHEVLSHFSYCALLRKLLCVRL